MKNLLITVFLFSIYSTSAHAYVYCVTKVKEIHPHKTNGIVYFKFSDGTAIQATENDSGFGRNMSIALAALIAGKEVKVVLNDGEECGSNRYEKWTYIVAISE